jgi:hypothetical protein
MGRKLCISNSKETSENHPFVIWKKEQNVTRRWARRG